MAIDYNDGDNYVYNEDPFSCIINLQFGTNVPASFRVDVGETFFYGATLTSENTTGHSFANIRYERPRFFRITMTSNTSGCTITWINIVYTCG